MTGAVPALRRRRLPHLSARRQAAGWLLTFLGIPLLTVLLSQFDGRLNLSTEMLLFLVLVVVVAIVGGLWPAIVAAVVASLAVNWFFTEPVHTFTIAEGENLVALVTFLVVATLVSALVTQVSRRSADASRARAEAEALAGWPGGSPVATTPWSRCWPTCARRSTVMRSPCWCPTARVGWSRRWRARTPRSPPTGTPRCRWTAGPCSSMWARPSTPMTSGCSRSSPPSLAAALERRHLKAEAAEAEALAEADLLRTAILRAVSHDLRTPLASIKASATSLLQEDVEWTPTARHEFLATIDEEADRLNDLVGNLLDMSRLETGALVVGLRPVALEETVALALASLSETTDQVVVDVSERLPAVIADPVLLERVVANVVSNALRYTPPDEPVRIEAGEVAGRVDLRIIDRGPGVPPADRERIFEPFQRLGDRAGGGGVGLGLAVARGFTAAMGGELALEDTPGGGLTAVISLSPAGLPDIPATAPDLAAEVRPADRAVSEPRP